MCSMYHVYRAALTFECHCYHSWLNFFFFLCSWHLLSTNLKVCNFPPGVRMTVLWAPLVRSATRGVSVRMEPSVTISMEPVCVKRGLKALIAKRDSVPRASTASSVTSTAPVIPPTLWGKWDISAIPHTASRWPSPEAKPPVAPYEKTLLQPNFVSSQLQASAHSEVWTPLSHVIQLAFNRDLCFIHNFSAAFIVNAMLMLWFRLELGTDHKVITERRRKGTPHLSETSRWMNCCWGRLHTLTLLRNEVLILSELKLRLTLFLPVVVSSFFLIML